MATDTVASLACAVFAETVAIELETLCFFAVAAAHLAVGIACAVVFGLLERVCSRLVLFRWR